MRHLFYQGVNAIVEILLLGVALEVKNKIEDNFVGLSLKRWELRLFLSRSLEIFQ